MEFQFPYFLSYPLLGRLSRRMIFHPIPHLYMVVIFPKSMITHQFKNSLFYPLCASNWPYFKRPKYIIQLVFTQTGPLQYVNSLKYGFLYIHARQRQQYDFYYLYRSNVISTLGMREFVHQVLVR